MSDALQELLRKIHSLEKEIQVELELKRQQFGYEIKHNRVRFKAHVRRAHRFLAISVPRYLRSSSLLHVLTVPIIWSGLLPALWLDLFVTIYQATCFPIYGIPRVRRRNYIKIDRIHLSYLNVIEKLNCVYCAYFNGLIAYTREVAARTEQYWCPIKHATSVKSPHSRYGHFIDFGDARRYSEDFEKIRRDFEDLHKGDPD